MVCYRYVLGTYKNCLIETVLLSTHSISFDRKLRRFRKFLNVKFEIFSYPSVLTYVLGAQKSRLIETVL